MQRLQRGRVVAQINLRQAQAETGLVTSRVGRLGLLVGAQGPAEIARRLGAGAFDGQAAGFRAVTGNGGDGGRITVVAAGRHGRRLGLRLPAAGGFPGGSLFAGKPAQRIQFLDKGFPGRRSDQRGGRLGI